MEVWCLNHPCLGRITVERGYDPEFAQRYPDWPETPDRDVSELVETSADSSFRQRLEAIRANPPVRLQVSVDGTIVARYMRVSSARIPLTSPSTEMRIMYGTVDRAQPHLKVNANFFDDLLSVEYREKSVVVELDPPPGSRAAKRREAMESSAFKRVAYPLAAGVAKSGWALAVLLLGPVVGRLIEPIVTWLAQFLPDVTFTPPQVYLPVPRFPQIHLPTPSFRFPQFDLPEMPGWMLFMMEYSKIWVPVIVGLSLGVLAIRNYRKSEAQKKQWDSAPGET